MQAAISGKIALIVLVVVLFFAPLLGLGAVLTGTVLGTATILNNLPANCKAPPNIFKAWDTLEDFITGVSCNDTCETNTPENGEDYATKGEYIRSIIGTGKAMNIPEKGIVIAITTSIVESGIRNYANDGIYDTSRNPADATLGAQAPAILAFAKKSMNFPHDAVGSDATSVGLFQQQAWWGTMGGSNWENDPDGTIKRLMDPVFQSQKFYDALLKINGWEQLPHGVAAQKVQVSAFPDAYATRVSEAQTLYEKEKGNAKDVTLYDFGGKFEGGDGEGSPSVPSNCGSTNSSTGIVLDKSALYQITAQFSQPRGAELLGAHQGMDIDCGDDWENVYTPVSGVVTIATNGNPSGYGSPAGDVMIKTDDGTQVQLHHLRNVFVGPGDIVEGGQAIGECASTGLSTGTHLHLGIFVGDSTNMALKALPKSPYLSGYAQEQMRDPALALDILGVDICPPYTADRKSVPPGFPLATPLKCWPPEEWTK